MLFLKQIPEMMWPQTSAAMAFWPTLKNKNTDRSYKGWLRTEVGTEKH